MGGKRIKTARRMPRELLLEVERFGFASFLILTRKNVCFFPDTSNFFLTEISLQKCFNGGLGTHT
jgi:hypothetical protein